MKLYEYTAEFDAKEREDNIAKHLVDKLWKESRKGTGTNFGILINMGTANKNSATPIEQPNYKLWRGRVDYGQGFIKTILRNWWRNIGVEIEHLIKLELTTTGAGICHTACPWPQSWDNNGSSCAEMPVFIRVNLQLGEGGALSLVTYEIPDGSDRPTKNVNLRLEVSKSLTTTLAHVSRVGGPDFSPEGRKRIHQADFLVWRYRLGF